MGKVNTKPKKAKSAASAGGKGLNKGGKAVNTSGLVPLNSSSAATGSDAPAATTRSLSRGQRKRKQKSLKAQAKKKEFSPEVLAKLKKEVQAQQQALKKGKGKGKGAGGEGGGGGALGSLSSSLMDSLMEDDGAASTGEGDSGRSGKKAKAKVVPFKLVTSDRVVSNRGKKNVLSLELGQLGAVMNHPAFVENPFATIQHHLQAKLDEKQQH